MPMNTETPRKLTRLAIIRKNDLSVVNNIVCLKLYMSTNYSRHFGGVDFPLLEYQHSNTNVSVRFVVVMLLVIVFVFVNFQMVLEAAEACSLLMNT